MLKNKTLIIEKLLSLGLSLGCYDSKIDKLSKEELNKIIDNLEYGSTDVAVDINKEEYVVEIFHVDLEVDFNVITKKEYAKTYGRIFYKER
jgi:hypothetical protein